MEKKKESELKKKLKNCQKEKEEFLAGWQRARADFLNYKKKELERIEEILKYAGEELILKILPILDNFEKAEKEILSINHEDMKYKEIIEGFLQIKTQLQDFLKNQGVKEIESLGKKFDPNFQEVIEEVEIENKEPGIVIEEIQKGYMLRDKLLRPAKVKIVKQRSMPTLK